MTGKLFDNAKFGDMFLTTENKQAVFLRFAENAEYKFAILYVEDWGIVQVFRHNGKEINNDAAHSIISKQEEPVSDDLEEEIKTCFLNNTCKVSEISVCSFSVFGRIARHFANWQKQQFEKDYTNLCNGIATVKGLAVKMTYDKGMADAREQMMKDAVDVVIGNEWGHPRCVLTQYDLEPLGIRSKDRVKIIVIKND